MIHAIERCEVLRATREALLIRSPYLPSALWIPRDLVYEDRHAFHRNDDGLPGPLHLYQLPFFPASGDVVVMKGGARPMVIEVRAESFLLGSFGWKKFNEWPIWGESNRYREVWRDGRKVWPFPNVRRPEPGMTVLGISGRRRRVLFVLYRGGEKRPYGITMVRYKCLHFDDRVRTIRYDSWCRWAREGEIADDT